MRRPFFYTESLWMALERREIFREADAWWTTFRLPARFQADMVLGRSSLALTASLDAKAPRSSFVKAFAFVRAAVLAQRRF
jgi:hypothetical protein